MENGIFCDDAEIEWEAILQQLPDSPGICLDDFLLEVSSTDVLLPSLDGDNNPAVQSTGEDSAGLQLNALSDILFNDEDFENFPSGDETGGFTDIYSFLADIASSPPQQGVGHVDGTDDVDAKGQIHVETSDYVDIGKNEAAETNASTKKRKRNRESALKSRERQKAYEKTLQSKCRMLEGKCRKLEQSFGYCSVENAVLRHELIRLKELKAHCHGGGAEPAALLKDSLQMESLLCAVIMWAMMTVMFVLPPAAVAPLKGAVVVAAAAAAAATILGERRSNHSNDNHGVGFGVNRRWRCSRKKMK